MDAAESLMRNVVDTCTDCYCCRWLMDTNCQFFPELYRLSENEKDTGEKITPEDLRRLADLCHYCALCPCPDILEKIITSKTLFIERDGLPPQIRILEDVELVGKLGGLLPGLSNMLLCRKQSGELIKKIAGIDPKRKMPVFPKENFPEWAKRHKLNQKLPHHSKRKVAYFAGCTARYLFPDVPKAVIDVFAQNNIQIYYPEQNCCGMPCLLEGDRNLTLKFSGRTVSRLAEVIDDGYDIVCSCPTCGFMLKNILRDNAYYSDAYQEISGGDNRRLLIPEKSSAKQTADRQDEKADTGRLNAFASAFGGLNLSWQSVSRDTSSIHRNQPDRFLVLNKSIYGKILRDDGYFSGIDPLKRIKVAENTYDLGEYLLKLDTQGALNDRMGSVTGQTLYYPPCHMREQGIGMPYMNLLSKIPGIEIDAIQSSVYCCGIAGIMGFKRYFHNASIQMGSRLMAKIRRIDPDILVTECLSCRLQFTQMSSYPVKHPIEILKKSYESYRSS